MTKVISIDLEKFSENEMNEYLYELCIKVC